MSDFHDPNAAASYDRSGFVEEPFPGRGGIDWAQQPTPLPVTTPRTVSASAYGYPFGSGLLHSHWEQIRTRG